MVRNEERVWFGAARDSCPECGSGLVHEAGCQTCYCCGWSACS